MPARYYCLSRRELSLRTGSDHSPLGMLRELLCSDVGGFVVEHFAGAVEPGGGLDVQPRVKRRPYLLGHFFIYVYYFVIDYIKNLSSSELQVNVCIILAADSLLEIVGRILFVIARRTI